jgi:transcriptional regulator with XRE-family HTH domain
MMVKKSPNSTDVYVGNQIRTRRQQLAMSQEKLADGLGLTFQQVQKYEKGTHRVGAGRLQAMWALLQVPISFFFEDASLSSTRKKAGDGPSDDFVTDFLRSADSHTLFKAFLRIKAADVRRSIVHMVESTHEHIESLCPRGLQATRNLSGPLKMIPPTPETRRCARSQVVAGR